MKTNTSLSLAVLAVALVGILPTQAAPGLVKSIAVGTGYESSSATGVATTFKTTVKVLHCVVKLTQRDRGNRYRAEWIAVDAGGMKNYKIVEKTLPGIPADTLESSMSLPGAWPIGKYRVNWLRDNKPLQSAAFSIK